MEGVAQDLKTMQNWENPVEYQDETSSPWIIYVVQMKIIVVKAIFSRIFICLLNRQSKMRQDKGFKVSGEL